MKLYHCKGARSMRPLWTLEELGVEFELITMEFPPRYTYEGYKTINPLGTVPTFVDGDVVMTESSGICQYIVEKYGPTPLAVRPDESDYGEYLNWLYRRRRNADVPQHLYFGMPS